MRWRPSPRGTNFVLASSRRNGYPSPFRLYFKNAVSGDCPPMLMLHIALMPVDAGPIISCASQASHHHLSELYVLNHWPPCSVFTMPETERKQRRVPYGMFPRSYSAIDRWAQVIRCSTVRLGNSGLKVSKLILGTMQYGSKEWQGWILEEEEAIKHIKAA